MDYQFLIKKYPRVITAYKKFLEETRHEKEKYGELFLKQIKSPVHGVAHWVRVGIYGLTIAEHLCKASKTAKHWESREGSFEEAVLYACFFHDTARDGEGIELEHGKRAEKAWRIFAENKRFSESTVSSVSQALLFHVAHPSVDPCACDVTICLCNADRLDRVRLGEKPIPQRMYDDGVWHTLTPHSERLLQEVNMSKVLGDLGEYGENLF